MSKSGKKKNLKRKFKSQQTSNDFRGYYRDPRFPKKAKRQKLGRENYTMSDLAASSSHATGGSDESVKIQCDICKLSYSSQAKLTEHLVSLIHHTKLDEADNNTNHECILCKKGFTDMARYRDHIGTANHLQKLEFLRGSEKEKPKKNSNWGQHTRNGRPHYKNQDRHASRYYGSHKDGHYRPHGQNQYHYNQSLRQNEAKQFMNEYDGQQNNEWHDEHGSYRGGGYRNNWEHFHDNGFRWQNDYGNPSQHRNERADDHFESYNGQNQPIPWGSGATNFAHNPFSWEQNSNQNRTWGSDYAQDNFDYCWDEQSFRQHEDFLADMDENYSVSTGPYFNGGHQRPAGPPHRNSHRSDTEPPKTGFMNGPSFNDRKRARHGNYPVNASSKSSKSLGQEDNVSNENRRNPSSHVPGHEQVDSSSFGTLHQNSIKTVYQDKSTLDNASDTILERAEKLCKELRQKREASNAQRANLLKSENHHSLNDKMNNLKKDQQSYIKGHIKTVQTELLSTPEDGRKSVVSPTASQSIPSSFSLHNTPPCSSSSKVKSLDEIRKSIEKSVLEDSKNVTATTTTTLNKAKSLRRRTSSLCESSLSSNSPETVHPSDKASSVVTGCGEGQMKIPSKSDSASISSHKNIPKSGARQSITKENLNKMVNCPRSRTERVQLARMFQSRGDSKSSAPISSRGNINLEGLYDSNDIPDIQLDVGGDLATIKLEELSDDIRNQILGLIQDDIGNIHDKHQESSAKKPEPDEKKTRKADSTFNDLNAGGKKIIDKKMKSKTVDNKIRKRNKTGADDTVDLSSSSEKFGRALSVTSDDQGVESSMVVCESLSHGINEHSKDDNSNQINLSTQSSAEHELSLLSSENITSRYPAILSAFGTKVDKMSLLSAKDKPSSLDDSGRSSLSLPSSSLSLPITSSSQTSSPLSLHQSSTSSPLPPTYSVPSMQMPTGLTRSVHSLSKEGHPHPDEHHSLTVGMEQSQDSANTKTTIKPSLTAGEQSSKTISELLTLSEQEECVKQEMMNMELRLTRLHRLLEQAVHQINTCTEKRNQLQDEEKNLVNRRISLLREATLTSQPSVQSNKPDLSGGICMQPSVTTSSLTTTTSSQSLSSNTISTEISRFNKTSLDIGSDKLPASCEDNVGNLRSSSSLSRSEWLAKFSAYLPKDALSSKLSSTESTTTISVASSINSSIQSFTSTAGANSSSSKLQLPQMVPERDSEPSIHRDAISDYRPPSVLSRHSDLFGSGGQDTIVGRPVSSVSLSNTITREPAAIVSHEFTSPIMYLGTINAIGGGQSNKTAGTSPTPVMVLNNATLTSLFKDSGESDMNVTPVTISGADRGQHQPIKDSTVPPISRRSSIGSPRQDDSDIGSIASVASGSSLGEQISRYCKFTPGASVDGYNRHELSVILSGPSDTSELKGPEDEHGDSDKSNNISDLIQLKEDKGNKRLYGRLDKESVKSAEALHLIERNTGNEDLTTSVADKKKKKRKTKQQRNSGMRGRPKPYVISSSSGDEVETSKVVEVNDVSSLEKRLRKSPESTTDGSSSSDVMVTGTRKVSSSKSDPLQSSLLRQQALYSSPSKTFNRTEITVAECDSSTNLGMVDSESLNERSVRLKEMNDSFKKNFGRDPTYVVGTNTSKSKTISTKRTKEGGMIVLSDSEDKQGGQHGKDSQVVDLCLSHDDEEFDDEKSSRFPGVHGPVCSLHYNKDQAVIYVGFLHYGFKLLHFKNHSQDREWIVPRLSCMEVDCTGDGDKVFVGSGHSVFLYELPNEDKRMADLGTTVKCLHVLQQTLYIGLDTGEICYRNIKSWKEINRYICSDCPIHCIASGMEAGTRLLCVASQDSTITVVDADRCLPLRILVGHSKTAFSVQVHEQFVFSGSGDSNVIIHNLHTARVEKVYEDHKGMVNCVFYSQGYLFTGGMDRLVRCYNVKTHKLVQVYYGADMGVIKTIYVHQDNMLITGNSVGSVDVVTIDLKAKNVCKHKGCGLNFGLATHLTWHIEHQHNNRS